MDSAWRQERNPNEVNHSSNELRYLFDVVDDRFGEAVTRQSRNKDVVYYTIETLDDSVYYTITLANRYLDIISREKDSEVLELLIPGLDSDIESPVVEQIRDNKDAHFLIRRREKSSKKSSYINVDTEGFSSNKEYKSAHIQSSSDETFDLAAKIRDYELIPSNVPPRYAPTDLIMKNLVIFPGEA